MWMMVRFLSSLDSPRASRRRSACTAGRVPMMKPDVAHGSLVVVPEMHMCDLYLEIDGKKFEDGHVCCGDGTLSKQKAIESVSLA